jgi:hypothetical protein
MPGCVLHVVGETLDPETVLSQLALKPYMTFHMGDEMFGRVFDKGGFKCSVSSSDGVLSEEITDAIAFLTKYETDRVHSAQNQAWRKCLSPSAITFASTEKRSSSKMIFCRQTF